MKAILLPFVAFAFIAPPSEPKASPAKPAAEPSLSVPAESKVYVPVVVKLNNAFASTRVKWKLTPEPAWSEKLTDGVGFRFTGPPAKYSIKVDYVDFKKELWGDAYAEVSIVGDGPTPPPPPVVTDPLQPTVNAAFVRDTPADPNQKMTAAKKYIAYYRAAAAACQRSLVTNTDQLWLEIQAVENQSGVSITDLPLTRAPLKEVMQRLYPNGASANTPLDPITRKATGDVYERFANLLEGATKQ